MNDPIPVEPISAIEPLAVPTHDELIAAIDAFQQRHPAIGDTRLGREATGESGLIGRLRTGSSPTLKVLNKIQAVMARFDGEAAEVKHADVDSATVDASSPGNGDDLTAKVAA